MKKEIKIFISSPNELSDAREACKKTIVEMDAMLGDYFRCSLTKYAWEDSTRTYGMGNPQSRTPNPADFDVYIGMLWTSFGSPTAMTDANGKEFGSGTYQEFMQAYEASQLPGGRPRILFLQKTTADINKPVDPKVTEFFEEFSTGRAHEGIYGRFDTEAELSALLRRWLFEYVSETDDTVNLHGHYESSGVVALYLKEDNDKRNEKKKACLAGARHIKLLARAGNSYLNEEAQRFYTPLYNCLEQGGTAEIILANPYSEMGYYLTLGDVNTRVCNETILERWNKSDARKAADAKRAITAIENARWVSTLNTAINGYLELKEQFGDRIVLRMSKYEINCTLLITESTAFFEPYIHCTGSTRGMNAFEVQMGNRNGQMDIYGSINQYFTFMWNLSEDYDEYASNIDNYKNLLQQSLLSGLFKRIQ